jgi:putative transposase
MFTENLAIEVGQKLKERVRKDRGPSLTLFCDNGSEWIARVMDLWAHHHGVRIDFSRPG